MRILFYVLIIFVMSSCAMPFIEGTWRYYEGEKYGFVIGDSKESTFKKIKLNFSNRDSLLIIRDYTETGETNRLESFELSECRGPATQRSCYYRLKVDELSVLASPISDFDRWEIEFPAEWVNSIHLIFENGMLKEIIRDRWLYERP